MTERLVIYDSFFGNTQKIAEAIGIALDNAAVKKVSEVNLDDLEDLQLLVIGSPTRAFQASPDIKSFLKGLRAHDLSGVKAAAFDTRISIEMADSGFLRALINLFGYADKKIEKALIKNGAKISINSEGFCVQESEGPLVEGELDRAQDWAEKLLS